MGSEETETVMRVAEVFHQLEDHVDDDRIAVGQRMGQQDDQDVEESMVFHEGVQASRWIR